MAAHVVDHVPIMARGWDTAEGGAAAGAGRRVGVERTDGYGVLCQCCR